MKFPLIGSEVSFELYATGIGGFRFGFVFKVRLLSVVSRKL